LVSKFVFLSNYANFKLFVCRYKFLCQKAAAIIIDFSVGRTEMGSTVCHSIHASAIDTLLSFKDNGSFTLIEGLNTGFNKFLYICNCFKWNHIIISVIQTKGQIYIWFVKWLLYYALL